MERTGSTVSRLAVFPVEAGAGVPEFLAEALTEETGRRLRALGDSTTEVLQQDSVSLLTSRRMSPAQVGATLKADLVLHGALQMLPARFRLRIEMMRGSDGSSLWAEDFVFPEGRLHSLSAELAHRISLRTSNGISVEAATDAAEDLYPQEAYELLWQAHSEWTTLQRHQMQDALQRLQRAVELAPHWIDARMELASLCAHQAIYGFMAPDVAANIIRRCAENLAKRGAEILLPPLGWVYFHVDRDLRAAQSAFDRSAHLPHDRWLTRLRAMFLLSRHQFGRAIGMLEKCIELDPYSAGLHARLAWAHHLAGNAAESVKRIEFALREFPQHELTRLNAAMILSSNGEAQRSIPIAEELVRTCPYLDSAMSAYAYALARAGRREESQELLEQLEWLSRERFVLRAFTPAVCVALGNNDAAMDELRAMKQSRCPWFFQTLADPRLKARFTIGWISESWRQSCLGWKQRFWRRRCNLLRR
jgi:TolB-like protein